MQKIRKYISLTILCVFLTVSLQGQQPAYNGGNYITEEDSSGSAYSESYNAAHWSAYVPITALVLAALLFAYADKNGGDSSSNSQDGLGSLGSSSSKSSRSGSCSCYKSYHSHY